MQNDLNDIKSLMGHLWQKKGSKRSTAREDMAKVVNNISIRKRHKFGPRN
jgi:hypothetical protein